MEDIIAFISENFNLSHGLMMKLGAIAAFISAYQRFIRNINGKVIELISQAEAKYQQDHTGKLKHDWVMNRLRGKRPFLFRLFFSDKKMDDMLEETFSCLNTFAALRHEHEIHNEAHDTHNEIKSDATYQTNVATGSIRQERSCVPVEPVPQERLSVPEASNFEVAEPLFDGTIGLDDSLYSENNFHFRGESFGEPISENLHIGDELPPIQFRVEHMKPSEMRITICLSRNEE